MSDDARTRDAARPLEAGVDFYMNDDGLMVFTAHYLKRRGFCCKSGCRHCPYGFAKEPNDD